MPTDSRQGSDGGIEVTPEMIEVGITALVEWEDSDNPWPRDAVIKIYRSMRAMEATYKAG